MNYQLHITKTAERDLNDAADYIEFTLRNPTAADHLLELAERTISQLILFPEAHPIVNDPILSAWGIRFVVIQKYIAFYTIEDHTIFILRFLYGKRDWMPVLKQGFSFE